VPRMPGHGPVTSLAAPPPYGQLSVEGETFRVTIAFPLRKGRAECPGRRSSASSPGQ
jgi:hypothetical protein